MKKDQKRKMRYSDEEMALTKATFAENDELMTALRKLFLQMPLDPIDKSVLDSAFKDNQATQKLLRKTYLPTLDPNAPRHQIIDLWMTVEVKDKSAHDVYPSLVAREKVIQYLDQQLQRIESGDYDTLTDIKLEDLVFTDQKTPAQALEDLIARNTLISHTEQQLAQLEILGGQKDETVEETQERLRKDSSK